MTKGIAILIVAIGSVLTVATWALVRVTASFFGTESHEYYFAPVFSPDGQYVYFVERRVSGDVRLKEPGDLFFSAPKYDVTVAKDSFSLKKLHLQSRQVEELIGFSPSPIEGRSYEALGDAFQIADARLRFLKDQQLECNVCLMLSGKEFSASGVWSERQPVAEISKSWKESYCQRSGDDEWPLFRDWELMEVKGEHHHLGVAIVAYNHVTSEIKVLVKSKDYDRLYRTGVPLQQLVKNSRRAAIERTQAMLRTHQELVQKYRAMGMGENQALLRTGKDMQRLGFYPKTPVMVARRLSREEAAKVDRDALFDIARGEMESGLFYDIEKAIASPGEEVDTDIGGYHTHRDYTTSARLNAFLETGKRQFYVRYLGVTYELTIKKP